MILERRHPRLRCSPFSYPTRPFYWHVANKALVQFDAWATLARRLGGPWATIGPPKGHPIPDPIPIPIRQRVATPETQNATESPLRLLVSQIPSTTFQVPVNRYPTVSLSLSHARTSSPAEDMSFAALCLTLVHVFSTGAGAGGSA